MLINIYGLLGKKLAHSVSPLIHKMIFEELKIEGDYRLFEVESQALKDKIYEFKSSNIKGLNVTIPYKIEIMEYLDEISEEANKISAVNTIAFEDGKLKGYNTDYYGFGMLIQKNKIEISDKNAVILGSGGASKSVYQYLLDNGINQITIVSRDKSKAQALFKNCNVISYQELEYIEFGDLIINCTPVGMYPDINSSPVEKAIVRRFSAAVDLIYNPKETVFLKYANEIGIKSVNGLYMLVGQAVKAQEIWNNTNIEDSIIEKIFNKINQNMIH